MSRLFSAAEMESAQAVPVGGLGASVSAASAASGGFQARFLGDEAGYVPSARGSNSADAPADPIEQARADGFAQGFDEAMRLASESLSEELANRERLTAALEQLAPAADGALSSLLSAAVMRLVSQIVGTAALDAQMLKSRCERVAAFIEDGQAKSALHVHPEDLPVIEGFALGVAVQPDPGLSRGCVRLDTVDGWIEDGPDVQLSRLHNLLDDMEGRA